ncbi:asparaginase [hydrothermal vent metagenome]|uniref:Asparaginase n=1 Tax=hydrothermal vent metagenome TaxID=652676 RepID=A0A1W1CQV3_9ZZZZ
MKKILVINTGGTFNKIYNPLTGNLDIDKEGKALKEIEKSWLNSLKIINIIGKDSLDMTQEDRAEILKVIRNSSEKRVIIIHGTDTIDKTANYLDKANLDKKIILTGAMVPYSINPLEATANFSSAYGYILGINRKGVHISMNGRIKNHKRVIKNKEKGYFENTK